MTISFDEEIAMKGSTITWLATSAILGFSLLLEPSAARADWGFECRGSLRLPQCSNGLDDDGVDGVDLRDPKCSSADDDDESMPGLQPYTPTCNSIVVRAGAPQIVQSDPFCPECYWAELIDFGPLLENPWSKIDESLDGDLNVTTPLALAKPVPGIVDDPTIPNLRLQYTGQDKILGPAVIGNITLRKPFGFPVGLQYVGQAFDTRAGRMVTNVGTLNAAPAAPPSRSGVFDAKLSYSSWRSGSRLGSLDGFDGEICPPWWPWPWPWPGPWRPRFDLRVSSYTVDKVGFSRVTPLELGLLLPFSNASRVTPYLGAGLGYYLVNGDSAAAQDKLGGYGALGIDIRLGERWGLSLEGAYREVGGNLDLGGSVVKAGVGFSF